MIGVTAAGLIGAACAPAAGPGIEPPAPTVAADTFRQGYTAADVAFMRDMIGHHQQALEMATLVPGRTGRRDFALMAERITLSQETEIAQMRRWLEERGEALPGADAHAHAAAGHGPAMPGMLTAAELAQLRSANGRAFERLFLELMIKHHEGALTMVRQLMASPGGGREPELFMLVGEIDADQTAEIRRMRALLASL